MKILKLLILSFLLIGAVGCGSFFGSRSQEVTFESDITEFELMIDTIKFEKSDKHIKRGKKKKAAKQITIKADGYKTHYDIIYANKRNPLYYLNIPFVLPLLFDNGYSAFKYNDVYTYNDLKKYPTWDSSLKRLIFTNIKVDIKDDDLKLISYDDISDFIDSDSSEVEGLKGFDFTGTIFDSKVAEIFKNNQFTDTSRYLFKDNLNTLKLDYNLTNVYLHAMEKERAIVCEIIGKWIIKDQYNDTLFNKQTNTKSGYFAFDNADIDSLNFNSFLDALEFSLFELLSDKKTQELLVITKEETKSFDKIVISNSGAQPKSLNEALKACVTIKYDGGHGSGFFISNDGYIITNHHVISKNKKYKVVLSNGDEIDAEVIRSNRQLDLALVKCDYNSEFAFKIPKEKSYKIGEDIFAIGTPKSIELGQSLSKGILSGTPKFQDQYYIQTDVAVNSGNSGGPIVNSNSELISVVVLKLIGFGTEGLSFSVPAELIEESLKIEQITE